MCPFVKNSGLPDNWQSCAHVIRITTTLCYEVGNVCPVVLSVFMLPLILMFRCHRCLYVLITFVTISCVFTFAFLVAFVFSIMCFIVRVFPCFSVSGVIMETQSCSISFLFLICIIIYYYHCHDHHSYKGCSFILGGILR